MAAFTCRASVLSFGGVEVLRSEVQGFGRWIQIQGVRLKRWGSESIRVALVLAIDEESE